MSSPGPTASPESLASIRALERSIDERGAERTVLEARLDGARSDAHGLVADAREQAQQEAARRRRELLAAAEGKATEIRAGAEREASELRGRAGKRERDLTALLVYAVVPGRALPGRASAPRRLATERRR